jgi:molecular chaperone GrpE
MTQAPETSNTPQQELGETIVTDTVSDTQTAQADQALSLQAELFAAKAQATEWQDACLRAKAETENARRRAAEDVSKAHKFAIENFAEHLLPVMDSLHAALADTSTDSQKLREGVELTLRQLHNALEKGKVVELNPAGEKFDPHKHQAIAMVPSDQPAQTVVAVLQRGYTIAERVLRPALVTVSQGS